MCCKFAPNDFNIIYIVAIFAHVVSLASLSAL
jgi:hypothetical protein